MKSLTSVNKCTIERYCKMSKEEMRDNLVSQEAEAEVSEESLNELRNKER